MCVYENKCMKINEKKNKVFINICVYLYSNEETPLMLRVSFFTTRDHESYAYNLPSTPLGFLINCTVESIHCGNSSQRQWLFPPGVAALDK